MLGKLPFEEVREGVVIHVRVTPRSSSNTVEGIIHHGEGVYLKIRVTATPENGEANEAVLSTLARTLGLPASRLTLLKGSKARIKSVLIAGGRVESLHSSFEKHLIKK